MKNKKLKILLGLSLCFFIWYLLFAFVDAEFNVWKWSGFVRFCYVLISYLTFNKFLEDLNENE